MCISAAQQKQKDDAVRESIQKTYNVCADGEKRSQGEYGPAGNVINNE